MPTYEYEHTDEAGEGCERIIEVVQSMKDDALTHCPFCFQPVKRNVSMPLDATVGKEDKLTDQNLERTGFTKYVNRGDGKYEKAAGPEEAPDVVDRSAVERNMEGVPELGES